MKIAGRFSFKGGLQVITARYPDLLAEVEGVIRSIQADQYRTKKSTERTRMGRTLFAPRKLNAAFKAAFAEKQWSNVRVLCEYPVGYYTEEHPMVALNKGAFREMDFVKRKLGVEVQFGKYSFMVYNVCAKMTIFSNLGIIDAGIEIVPIKQLANEMSSGVSYFEQFVWDLEQRGVADIDIPVLILGVSA